MSNNTIKQPAAELLNTQNNAEENQNNSNYSEELIEREDIEGTPFQVIGNKEKGYFIALGRFRISEVKKDREEAENLLSTDRWNIIVNLIITLSGEMDNFNEAVTVTKEK